MHGAYETIENRPALRFERQIAHPVEAVWRALTEPEQLKQWFPSTVSGDLRVGGRLTFTFEAHEAPTMHGDVTELEPPRVLAFYWGDDHLRFELEPVGDGCRLRFTCVLDAREKAARDAAGWHVCLDRLEQVVAGASTEGLDDAWRAHYAEYERRGLPTGAPVPN